MTCDGGLSSDEAAAGEECSRCMSMYELCECNNGRYFAGPVHHKGECDACRTRFGDHAICHTCIGFCHKGVCDSCVWRRFGGDAVGLALARVVVFSEKRKKSPTRTTLLHMQFPSDKTCVENWDKRRLPPWATALPPLPIPPLGRRIRTDLWVTYQWAEKRAIARAREKGYVFAVVFVCLRDVERLEVVQC